MKPRQWIAGLAVLTLAISLVTLIASDVPAGNQEMRKYLMIAGDLDSTEQVTRWIPVRGASRVILRSWSTHLGFGSNADTTKVDSIAGWKTLFSDSICCFVTGPEGGTIASAQDSIVNAAAAADTSSYGIGIYELPVNRILRGAANGSGLLTFVAPIQPGSLLAAHNGTIGKEMLRIRFTPVRRSTGATVSATVPNRTNGLRGFKMLAYVLYENR